MQMWKPWALVLENFISWFVNQFLIGKVEGSINIQALEQFFDVFPHDDPQHFFSDFELTGMPTEWLWEKEAQGKGIGAEFAFPSDTPLGDPVNDQVHGVALLHPAREQSHAMILLHGWITPFHQQSLRVARELLPLGYSTFMMESPYHMRRTPPGRFSGIHLIDPDLRKLYYAIRQSVADLCKLIEGLRQLGYRRFSLCSISMGAQTAAMAASMPAYQGWFDSLTLFMPSVDLNQTFARSPIMELGRRLLEENQISEERLQRYLEPLRLSHFRPLLPPERIILVNARYDRIVFPHKVRELWKAWGGPRLLEEPHGHVSLYFSGDPIRHAAEVLRNLSPAPALPQGRSA
jgi:pimeloyl-ACP methyl ester carboxylesterase